MKKYKSCTAEIGEYCSKHRCIHKKGKFISKIELEERIKDAQSEIRICRRELKRRAKKMRSKK